VFGVKIGITESNSTRGAGSFASNPYSGHGLESCLEQSEIVIGTRTKEVFAELGCRSSQFTKLAENLSSIRAG